MGRPGRMLLASARGCRLPENKTEKRTEKREKLMKQQNGVYSTLVVLGVAAALSGCALIPGKVTGGGTIPSTVSGSANFGFNANACDPNNVKGTFTFQDKAAGVKLNGDITRAGKCVFIPNSTSFDCGCPPDIAFSDSVTNNLYFAQLTYRSTNPNVPGSGTAIACAKDNGEGGKADFADIISFDILTGPAPYQGYSILNELSGGNIQGHSCK